MNVKMACAALVLAAAITPAGAQQRARQEQGWRPAWAKEIPEETPAGSIGLMVNVFDRNPFACILTMQVVNRTDATLRSAMVSAEVFFGGRSVVTQFVIQYADPGQWREVRPMLSEPCPQTPTRMVIREIIGCTRGQAWRRGCGAPFVQIAPRLHSPVSQFPVELAPDFDR